MINWSYFQPALAFTSLLSELLASLVWATDSSRLYLHSFAISRRFLLLLSTASATLLGENEDWTILKLQTPWQS
jgi:hypothetical protein